MMLLSSLGCILTSLLVGLKGSTPQKSLGRDEGFRGCPDMKASAFRFAHLSNSLGNGGRQSPPGVAAPTFLTGMSFTIPA